MANGIPSIQSLSILINAKTGGLLTEVKAAHDSMLGLATAEERETLAAATLTAAKDKEAAAIAKVQLVAAKAGNDDKAIAAAQQNYNALLGQSNISKAEAAAKTQSLKVAQLEAAAAADAEGKSTGALSGIFGGVGADATKMGAAIKSALTTVLPLAAAGLVFKGLKDGITGFEELGHEIKIVQETTNSAASTASLFVGQTKGLGVDTDTAAKALVRMGAAIGDGTSKLGKYGIQIALNSKGQTDLIGTFNNLRAAYQGSTDAATKDAIAKQLSLRAGTALVPLLSATKDQIWQLNAATAARGGILSQSDVDHAYQLKIGSNEMSQSFKGLEITLSKGVVPDLITALHTVTDITSAVTKITSIKVPGFGGDVFNQLQGIANPLKLVYDGVTKDINGLTGAHHANAQAAAADAAAAQAAAEAASKEADAEVKLNQALLGDVDAKKAVRDAQNQIIDSQYNLTKAQGDYNDLLATHGINVAKEVSAYDSLVSAADSVTTATDSETRAQDALSKATQHATELELAQAQNKIALAGDAIDSAKAAQQAAGEKLSTILGSGASTASEKAAAEAELKARTDDVTKAILDQQVAVKDQTT